MVNRQTLHEGQISFDISLNLPNNETLNSCMP